MAFSDFTLPLVLSRFNLSLHRTALFSGAVPIPASERLQSDLQENRALAVISEKARSEFIIVPILIELRHLTGNRIAIYSGERFDVEPASDLAGECDFILTLSEPLPVITTPVVTLIEAKKQDIEAGLGQCAAQMVAAQRFNMRHSTNIDTVFGCVTTGETWQFLRLTGNALDMDADRYYITELDRILGVLLQTVQLP